MLLKQTPFQTQIGDYSSLVAFVTSKQQINKCRFELALLYLQFCHEVTIWIPGVHGFISAN